MSDRIASRYTTYVCRYYIEQGKQYLMQYANIGQAWPWVTSSYVFENARLCEHSPLSRVTHKYWTTRDFTRQKVRYDPVNLRSFATIHSRPKDVRRKDCAWHLRVSAKSSRKVWLWLRTLHAIFEICCDKWNMFPSCSFLFLCTYLKSRTN